MASEGYPGHYERDRVIQNLEAVERMPDVKVFHAGTTLRTDAAPAATAAIVTEGGRVLNVTALGETLEEAQARAYEAVRADQVPGAWYRRDIGRTRRPPGPMTPATGRRYPCRSSSIADESVTCRFLAARAAFFAMREQPQVARDVVDLEQALEAVLARVIDRRGDVGRMGRSAG